MHDARVSRGTAAALPRDPVVVEGLSGGLRRLVARLDAAEAGALDAERLGSILGGTALDIDDLAPFVTLTSETYSRTVLVRRDGYELLVLCWLPGQTSPAHDHGGSACAIRVVHGRLTEVGFEAHGDGTVSAARRRTFEVGEVAASAEGDVHSVVNDPKERSALVTLHAYSPPLGDFRRYQVRGIAGREAGGERGDGRRTVCVIGGGFCGAMTAANLLRAAREAGGERVRVVLVERGEELGRGVAYGTSDADHLLNVPAARMSAWADRPADFFEWARAQDAGVAPTDFLPRRLYGRYVAETLARAVAESEGRAELEVVRDEAVSVDRRIDGEGEGGWRVVLGSSAAPIRAQAVVLALGHRPPSDPLARRWSGSRERFVGDPWRPGVLERVGPDDAVLVVGTGLTAVDVVLTLARSGRAAPVVAVSRRGFAPNPHATAGAPLAAGFDPAALVGEGLTTRRLVRAVREAAEVAEASGAGWRSVIDALRPHSAAVWRSLGTRERRRFVEHVRPFWEVHRHRVPGSAWGRVRDLMGAGMLRMQAARIDACRGDGDGVTVSLRRRGASEVEAVRVGWVINCTGPSSDIGFRAHPLLASLAAGGHVRADALGLGVVTDGAGRPLDERGAAAPGLLVVGTLRKPDLWESTAVPELRVQAAEAARLALAALGEVRRGG